MNDIRYLNLNKMRKEISKYCAFEDMSVVDDVIVIKYKYDHDGFKLIVQKVFKNLPYILQRVKLTSFR